MKSDKGNPAHGRKPVMLVFNKNAGYSIGIDIGVDSINGILTDLKGNIVVDQSHQLEKPSFDRNKDVLFSMIKELSNQIPDSPYGLIGIGICVPGLVSTEQKVIFTPNFDWNYQIDLKADIEKEFQVPVFIENEANAGAYGEKVFGAA